jgi:MFS family permease
MALGLFIFGLGVSPVSVVQETIIVRFFKSHGLGLSMALGLIAGKGASFLSARTSYPLTDHFGPRAPFYVSTFFAAFSVAVNLVYIGLSSRLVDGANAELEAADISHEARSRPIFSTAEGQALSKMAKSHQVQIHQITKLGDIFWSCVTDSGNPCFFLVSLGYQVYWTQRFLWNDLVAIYSTCRVGSSCRHL